MGPTRSSRTPALRTHAELRKIGAQSSGVRAGAFWLKTRNPEDIRVTLELRPHIRFSNRVADSHLEWQTRHLDAKSRTWARDVGTTDDVGVDHHASCSASGDPRALIARAGAQAAARHDQRGVGGTDALGAIRHKAGVARAASTVSG